MGKIIKATQSYKELFTLTPPLYVYEGYIKFLFETQQYNTLLAIEQPIWEHFANHWELSLDHALAHLYTGKDTLAEEFFESMIKKFPDNEQIIYYATLLCLKQNKLDKALTQLDSFLTDIRLTQKHSLFYFLKSKIYLQKKQPEEALTTIEKSLSLYPNFDKGLLFKGLLLEQMGRVTDAISGYQRFLEVTPGDESVEKQLITLLFSEKRYQEASQELRKIPTQTSEHFFDLALVEWRAGNPEEALTFVEKALEKKTDFKQGRLLKIEILLGLKKIDTIIQMIKTWICKKDPQEEAIQMIQLLSRDQLTPATVITLLEEAVDYHKTPARISALADFYAAQKQIKNAVKTYKQLFLHLGKDEKYELIKSKLFFQLGHLYFINKEFKKARTMLEKAITYKRVYAGAYNLLAYEYAEHDLSKLDKALILIEKALLQEPSSSVYRDTKGWILYKQNKFNEAQIEFQKALDLAPQDEVIQKHLTKVQTSISTSSSSR